MEAVWTRCLGLGLDVVLDFGFWSRAERNRVPALVEGLGGQAILYHLGCPDDVALDRIARRNLCLAGSLHITPATYAELRARFEPLGPDEPSIDVPFEPERL